MLVDVLREFVQLNENEKPVAVVDLVIDPPYNKTFARVAGVQITLRISFQFGDLETRWFFCTMISCRFWFPLTYCMDYVPDHELDILHGLCPRSRAWIWHPRFRKPSRTFWSFNVKMVQHCCPISDTIILATRLSVTPCGLCLQCQWFFFQKNAPKPLPKPGMLSLLKSLPCNGGSRGIIVSAKILFQRIQTICVLIDWLIDSIAHKIQKSLENSRVCCVDWLIDWFNSTQNPKVPGK